MAKLLSRVAPWLASRNATTHGPVRVLVHEDSDALRSLVARDPVANVFVDSLLAHGRTAIPALGGAVVLGYFEHDGAELAAACWVGSNVVPIQATPEQGASFGDWIAANWQGHASIFGPADAVLPLMGQLTRHGISAQEIRAEQPLLTMTGPSPTPANNNLRASHPVQFPDILTAAVAMFEEEVGYSPFLGGEENYRRRVASLISNGHSFSHCEPYGEVIFKADLGAVTAHATQIQGVWMNPRYRGQGLSAGYMAALVNHALALAPTTSLYVNDYNTRARAVYDKVGFEQVGTFATVLF